MARPAFFAACSLATAAAQIDPQFAENVTLYHLNPLEAGVVPVNMDTGDERGDLYFYLGQFLLPIECADPSGRAKFDCDNPERFGDTVVTKVVMEIDNRWTTYSACNLCNGTDPFTHTPCDVGSYVCDCFDWKHEHPCDVTKVGLENKTGGYDIASPSPNWGPQCNKTAPDYTCWQTNIQTKVGGLWFSTLKEGMCNESSPVGSCSWRVLEASTVNSTCLDESLMSTVEAAAPDCFSQLGPRNASSPDWIGCFMDTLLGPEARDAEIDYSEHASGMLLDDIVDSWLKPFLDEAEGGCPKIPSPAFYGGLITV